MNPGEFMKFLGETFAYDQELQNWAWKNHGRPLSVFVGVDEREEPPAEQYPMVVLVECTKAKGDQGQPKLVLQVGAGLYNEGVTKSVLVGEENILTVLDGTVQVGDLEAEIVASIFRTGVGSSVEIVGERIGISFHPMHVVNFLVEVELLKSSRHAVR